MDNRRNHDTIELVRTLDGNVMFRNVTIHDFRGLTGLTLENLRQVNILTGYNNVGKTSALEAIFLLSGGHNPQTASTIQILRGHGLRAGNAESSWGWLFPGRDTHKAINVSGESVDTGKLDLLIRMIEGPAELTVNGDHSEPSDAVSNGVSAQRLKFTLRSKDDRELTTYSVMDGDKIIPINLDPENSASPSFLMRGLSNFGRPDMDRFGAIVEDGRLAEVLDAAKELFPEITSLMPIVLDNVPYLLADVGLEKPIPVSMLGSGLQHLLRLVCTVIDARGGVVCIDDVDAGMHTTMLPKLWQLMGTLAEQHNVQIFATTHSYESLSAASDALGTDESRLKVISIRRDKKRIIKAVHYSTTELQRAVESGYEVR
jgi:hypothetical protein